MFLENVEYEYLSVKVLVVVTCQSRLGSIRTFDIPVVVKMFFPCIPVHPPSLDLTAVEKAILSMVVRRFSLISRA